MNKNTIFGLVVIVMLVIGLLVWRNMHKKEPVAETPVQALDKATQADTTDAIDTSLNAITVDTNIDADLNSIDTDLKNL